MWKRVFCVAGMGDLVTDLMVSIDRFPVEPVGHQMIDRIEMQPGGMGNFLIAGQRIGLKMIPIDLMGMDQYGKSTLEALKAENIDISQIQKVAGASSKVIIVLTDANGKHAFLAYRKNCFSTQTLSAGWKKTLAGVEALFVAGYSFKEEYIRSALLEAMEFVRSQGRVVFFDPGPMVNELSDLTYQQAMRAADVLLLTEDELALAVGGRGVVGAHKLLDQGVKLVCIKCGEAGCRIVDIDHEVICAGYPAKVIDTIGAGDSFAAAFIYGYLHEWPLSEVGAFANAMGAAKVQKFGAGRNVPTMQEIKAMIVANKIELPDFNG